MIPFSMHVDHPMCANFPTSHCNPLLEPLCNTLVFAILAPKLLAFTFEVSHAIFWILEYCAIFLCFLFCIH